MSVLTVQGRKQASRLHCQQGKRGGSNICQCKHQECLFRAINTVKDRGQGRVPLTLAKNGGRSLISLNAIFLAGRHIMSISIGRAGYDHVSIRSKYA